MMCLIGVFGQPNTTLFVVNFDPDRTRPRDLEDAFGSKHPPAKFALMSSIYTAYVRMDGYVPHVPYRLPP